MKYFVALLLAGALTGCLGGSTAPGGALPPELQGGGSQPSSTGTVDPVDPLAGFPPLPADVDSAPEPATNEEPISLTPETSPASATNCEAVVADLERSIVDMNFCSTDSDCAVGEGSCPFGCYLFHNKSIDFADYQATLKDYRDNCNPCEYKCASSPRATDRRCREGRCVDARFE